MISLLPINRMIGYVAVFYALLVVLATLAARKFGDDSLWRSVIMAFSGATLLQIGLLSVLYFGWRTIWQWFPVLNHLVFPDIAGEWTMQIHWQGQDEAGVVNANVILKQDLVRLSMEVQSPKSHSQTLIAQPKRDPESGRPVLYYVYLVVPNTLGVNPGAPYYGAAILRFFEDDGEHLKGNYWTSQQTRGHFSLRRRPAPPLARQH